MFFAVLAFTFNTFRNYFTLNHQRHSIADESDDEEEDDTGRRIILIRCNFLLHFIFGRKGIPSLSVKLRSILTYLCTCLWGISIVILLFMLYASIRGPLNLLNNFNNGKSTNIESFILLNNNNMLLNE